MMNQKTPKAPGETQIQPNRACDACRHHKVRCLPDSSQSSTSKICQRCARTDRRCIFTVPQKRKQRKKTDVRVAELEREVEAMRALFEGRKSRATTDKSFGLVADENSPQYGDSNPITSPMVSESWTGFPDLPNSSAGLHQGDFCPLPTPGDYPTSNPFIPLGKDVIERGIIPEELAAELFHTFMEDLAPHSPMVVFPPATPMDDVRRARPSLFLAVIAAAAGKSDPSLFSILSSEVLSAYTHRTVMNREKSLELVQTMIVISIWYYPPGKFAQLKFYEYIHAAATMAFDIGLGTKPVAKRRRQGELDEESPNSCHGPEPDLEDLERKRTFLACYLMCTGVAMSMRRPSMLRSNKWVVECVDVLSSSPLALPHDKIFCHWVRLTIIAEDIYTSFSFDDESNCANLSETRIQFMLKSFEKRLEDWKAEITPDMTSVVLTLGYCHINMYAHEIAMHEEHPPEDFRPPFRIDKPLELYSETKLTSAHVDCIASIISSAHNMFDLLLGMSVDVLRSIPIYNFVRMAYGCVLLTKLYTSTRADSSQLGTVLDRNSLNIGFYLKALIERLTEAVGPMECRAPYTFLGLLMRLQEWYLTQEAQTDWVEGRDLINEKTIMSPPSDSLPTEIGATTSQLSSLMDNTLNVDQIYPIDPSYQEMADLGLQHGFSEGSTAYIPQFQHTNFMDPFQLFDGLDSLGVDFDWSTNPDVGDMGIGGGEMPEWSFDG